MSVLEMVSLILDVAGREDLQPVVMGKSQRETDRQYLSAEYVERTLGWRPAAPLRDRLCDTVAWYRDHVRLCQETSES